MPTSTTTSRIASQRDRIAATIDFEAAVWRFSRAVTAGTADDIDAATALVVELTERLTEPCPTCRRTPRN